MGNRKRAFYKGSQVEGNLKGLQRERGQVKERTEKILRLSTRIPLESLGRVVSVELGQKSDCSLLHEGRKMRQVETKAHKPLTLQDATLER